MHWFERMFRTGNERTDTPGVSWPSATALLLMGAHSAGATINYTAVQTDWDMTTPGVTALLVLMTMGAITGLGMLVVTGDGEKSDRENKNQNADQKKQETIHNYSAPDFNGCAFSSRYCIAKGTLAAETSALWLRQIYKLPSVRSFFIPLFKNCDTYSPKEHACGKTKEKYPGVNLPGIGWNKIADDGTGKNDVANINTNSGNRLDLVIVQESHRLNNIIGKRGCQAQLRREMGHALV